MRGRFIMGGGSRLGRKKCNEENKRTRALSRAPNSLFSAVKTLPILCALKFFTCLSFYRWRVVIPFGTRARDIGACTLLGGNARIIARAGRFLSSTIQTPRDV